MGLWPGSFGIVYPIGARKERDEWSQKGVSSVSNPCEVRKLVILPHSNVRTLVLKASSMLVQMLYWSRNLSVAVKVAVSVLAK